MLEDALRRLQISGKQDSLGSFMIRPLSTSACISFDSLYNPGEYLQRNKGSLSQRFAHGKGVFRLLPAMLTQQYNSHHPYGWNDGSMIQAKGYQVQASAGIYASLGMLSVQFRPEFIYAQNSRFETFPEWHSDSLWHQYYERSLNWIDNPERYGDKSYRKIFPGQSSVRLNYKKLSLGVSTENLWWGPGIRNSILMSNTAPGFAHITFNTTAPIKTPIGSLEWQVISGLLQNSSILPPDTGRTFNGVVMYQPKRDESRYLNGMVLTWQPKWLSNFYLGFSRVFYLYKTDIQSGLDGYLPIIGTFFKGATNNEDEKQRDQMLSFFFRLVLPKEKAEVYGEFGRNDHSQNTRDFLLEPEHSRAY
ncbi:MAG: hypothetical protein J7527_19570, partial [Chitinophagaceae bacterium]|nr:hypothetical protein [Chitinophagaceae bacterium]